MHLAIVSAVRKAINQGNQTKADGWYGNEEACGKNLGTLDPRPRFPRCGCAQTEYSLQF